ncbi:hypothetical protein BZA77DRAFT_80006 [Pyronema omphalodes]|nr:hypothetical protein BZA77DRAFT_80006 [Pyronema omphalodes]
MDTPRSESPSYMPAIPATELDDHRHQPHSLPRSNTATSTFRPDLSHLHVAQFDRLGLDNEFAVHDDDDDMKSPKCIDHAAVARKNSARSRHSREARRSVRSSRSRRFSRASSRSPSPPNSVDAFADPETRRRERSNTMNSTIPDDLRLTLQRTNSRRPTFCESDERIRTESDALKQAEEDVCFPPEDATTRGGFTIDFEDMEEYVLLKQSREFSNRNNEEYPSGDSASELRKDMDEKDDTTARSQQPSRSGNPDSEFSFFHSELDTTVHASDFPGLLLDGQSFHDLFRGGKSVWWLDCLNPTTEEVNMLTKAFGVHPLTAEDIRMQETREKVELFKSYYFVCFRSFVQDKNSEDYMDPINVYMVVFREGILSFHFAAAKHSANVRKRIRMLRDYVNLSADWICYALIDDITDSFAPLITDIEKDTDAIEDAVFIARQDDYTKLLKRIGDCRKKTMSGMRLLGGKADVIKGFAKRCNEHYQITPRGEIGLYLGDIQDHILTMAGNLAHFEKMLSRSHANYLAQLSVDSIQANNKANEVLSKITTIATILVPLNLICGLFGMNVPVPGMESGSLAWFFGILGTIFLFCFVSFFAAKRWKFI